jgi:L-amino acid N-acyltransferase YncA
MGSANRPDNHCQTAGGLTGMSEISFKSIEERDLNTVLDIYNHYIRTTTASFRPEPIPVEILSSFIYLDHNRYKAYLIYHLGEIAGFCFLTQYKNLEAYDRTAEMGIYLRPGCTRRGLGKEAARHLEEVAAANGIKTVIASISGDNTASIRLFRKLGYEQCGHFKRVGEKFGRVLDVIFFQRSLDNGMTIPGEDREEKKGNPD